MPTPVQDGGACRRFEGLERQVRGRGGVRQLCSREGTEKFVMAAHSGRASENAPSSQRRMLAILVLSGMLTIGFSAAALTDSYSIGIISSLLIGACIIIAHLMIAPGAIIGRGVTYAAAAEELPVPADVFDIRHG